MSSLNISNNNQILESPQISQEQINFIQTLQLPMKVNQLTASDFDLKEAYTSDDIWNFVIGAERQALNFKKITD